MAGSEDNYDPFINPAEEWGDPDYTPDGYNENLQVFGSQFAAKPQNIETGLDRDLGAGSDELLEGGNKANIADLLVEKRLWDSMRDVGKARDGDGWYAIDFYMEGEDRNYQGFLRPVENLGWDVVLQEHDSSDIEIKSPQAGIAAQHSPLNSRTEDQNDSKVGNYYGHFMPFN